MRNKGFTLIELLIVIALLGALAVGLLAAIDPFEQLKKGRDTSTRNTTAEFYNASIRYYSTNGNFPWNKGGTDNSFAAAVTMTEAIISATALPDMITAGELKAKFYELAGINNLGRIYITSPTTESIISCFIPESKSFKQDQNVVFDQTGGTTSGCVAQTSGGSTSCYWCIQ